MQSSCHGKLIWTGEYACLEGYPAVVSDLPFEVVIEENGSISGDLLPGVGLGYSSALLGAKAKALGESDVESYINIHEPDGSGIDAFGVTHEGLFSWSKTYFYELDEIFFSYFLINTGCEDSTADMLSSVGNQDLYVDIGRCTDLFVKGIELKDLDLVSASIDESSNLLFKLGVVDRKSASLIAWLRKGGFVGKTSGAGGRTNGSGVIIGIGELSDEQKHKIESEFGCNIIYESRI